MARGILNIIGSLLEHWNNWDRKVTMALWTILLFLCALLAACPETLDVFKQLIPFPNFRTF